MADDQKDFIRLHGKEIEVSEDVYYAYYRMERQERWQEEKSRSTMSCHTAVYPRRKKNSSPAMKPSAATTRTRS